LPAIDPFGARWSVMTRIKELSEEESSRKCTGKELASHYFMTYDRSEEDMQVEKLLLKEKEDFLEFCLKHRSKVDESYLDDLELENFNPNEENPTFVVKEDGKIVAAASLIMDDYHKRGRGGRFRIFYSENGDWKVYSALLLEVVKSAKEMDKVFLFVPLANKEFSNTLEKLHFEIERYVFLLIKEITELPVINLPEGYSIRKFQPDKDEYDWCNIRNTAFSTLKGNSTPITPDMVQKQLLQPEYLEGGFLLLLHNNNPVGIIRGTMDDYEGEPAMNIGPFAILPAYQGKGLGRQLLRAALGFAQKMDYRKAVLCVNAENERAKELYLQEGFIQMEGLIAYEYPVSQEAKNLTKES
jgi:mycothiol synthase